MSNSIPPAEGKKAGNNNTLEGDDLISDVLLDVEDVCRLTFNAGLAPIIQKSTGRQIRHVRQRVARLLSPIIPGEENPRQENLLDGEDLESLEAVEIREFIGISGENLLRLHQKQIQKFIAAVVSHPAYKEAIHAYEHQNNISTMREDLYRFLAQHGFQEVRTKRADQPLYHGISLGETGDDVRTTTEAEERMSRPAEYLEKIQSIRKKGIRAGDNPENLPGLESVFCTENIKYAHGVAAVEFGLKPDEKIWGRTQGLVEGRHLVQPVLKRENLDLVLRSDHFYDVLDSLELKDVFGLVGRQQYGQFIKNLIEHLRAARLSFRMIDPDGQTRAPLAKET